MPLPRAGHVLTVTWMYVTLVLTASIYSSRLTASLTVSDLKPPFSSMAELVSLDTYTWGVTEGTALQSILRVRVADLGSRTIPARKSPPWTIPPR